MTKKYKQGLYWELLEQAEIAIIGEYLEKNEENVAATARELGLHYTHLQRKIDKLGLGKNDEGNAAWKSLKDDD
jgi:transcriptional regulator with PAS, ATPase and Fis domain